MYIIEHDASHAQRQRINVLVGDLLAAEEMLESRTDKA